MTVLLVTAWYKGSRKQPATLTPTLLPEGFPGFPPLPSPTSYPPGVTASGVENASMLVSGSYARSLGTRRSYTVRNTKLYVMEKDLEELSSETSVQIGANGSSIATKRKCEGQLN